MIKIRDKIWAKWNGFYVSLSKWLKITLNGIILVGKRFSCRFSESLDIMKWKAFLHEKTSKQKERLINKICGYLIKNCEMFVSLYGKIFSDGYRNMRMRNAVTKYKMAKRGYFHGFEVSNLLMQDMDCLNRGRGKRCCSLDKTFVGITRWNSRFW